MKIDTASIVTFLVLVSNLGEGTAAISKTTAIAKYRSRNLVCYFQSWTMYRLSHGKFEIKNIDPKLCTHIIYAYVGVKKNGEINLTDDDENLVEFNKLKLINPNLKTLLSVGGWEQGSKIFSNIAASRTKRKNFIESATKFLNYYGFNGLDFSWCYPGQRDGNRTIDKRNYATFLKQLNQALSPHNFLLSTPILGIKDMIKLSFNVPEIGRHVDLIHLIGYDFSGSWEPKIGIHGALFSATKEQDSVKKGIDYLVKNGIPAEKLNLGIALYGRTFTLKNITKTEVGSAHIGDGIKAQYSDVDGEMCYFEFCEEESFWTQKWHDSQQVPYAYKGNQWIGYENSQSVELKSRYANERNLAGIMIWAMECDDFHGTCRKSQSKKFPLLRTIKSILDSGVGYPEFEYTINVSILKKNLKFNNYTQCVQNNSDILYFP